MITSSWSVIHTFTVVPVDRRRLVRAPPHLDPCSRFFELSKCNVLFSFSPILSFHRCNAISIWFLNERILIVSFVERRTCYIIVRLYIKIVLSSCDIHALSSKWKYPNDFNKYEYTSIKDREKKKRRRIFQRSFLNTSTYYTFIFLLSFNLSPRYL